MRLFIDEAGNTGSIIDRDEILNYGTQRHFCLASVVTQSTQEEEQLRLKYRAFKEQFSPNDELKGNTMLTKAQNTALNFFIDKLLDSQHFSICYYDKKFYLVTLMLIVILGFDFRNTFPVQYYTLASKLSQEDDVLLSTFCRLSKNANIKTIHKLFLYLKDYPYKYISKEDNLLAIAATEVLKDEIDDTFVHRFLQFGSYSNPKIANLINLNALSELCEIILIENRKSSKQLEIFHDNISGIDKLLYEELAQFGLKPHFIDSKSEELIQYADNISSIFCKIINTIVRSWEEHQEWNTENEWLFEAASKLYQKIGLNNIKFTVPIQNWATVYCVAEMFDKKFPKAMRDNLHFNKRYLYWSNEIVNNLARTDFNAHADCFAKLCNDKNMPNVSLKTIDDLENMKSQNDPIFSTAYESFISTLEDYYIAKLDGRERIAREFTLWNKDAQIAIANILIKRISQDIVDFDPTDILSLIK